MKLKKLIEDINKKIEAIYKLIGFTDQVSWDDMKKVDWKVGEVLHIDETRNTKLYEDDYHIKIQTVMPPGSSFTPSHFHDFVEFCTVKSGQLFEPLLNRYTAVGGRIAYDYMQPHEPTNDKEVDCVLIVDWVKTADIDEAIRYLDNASIKPSASDIEKTIKRHLDDLP